MVVRFSVRSMVKAGFIGGGAAVQFLTRTDPVVALEALLSAADAAEQQFEDDMAAVSTSSAIQGPGGPILFMQLCDSAELLDQWCRSVAQGLEAAGLTGRLAPAASVEVPRTNAPVVTSCLQLLVDWDALLQTPAYYNNPEPGWWVDAARTERLLDIVIPWVLQAPGEVNVTGPVGLSVPRAGVRAIVSNYLTHSYGVEVRVTGNDSKDDLVLRSVKFLGEGSVLLQAYDDSRPWQEHLETVQAPTLELVEELTSAYIRPTPLGVMTPGQVWGFPPQTPVGEGRGIGSRLWVVLHLLSDHMPDAFGTQILSRRHWNRLDGLDPERWTIKPVGADHFLVVATDLDAWFDTDYSTYRGADDDNPYTRAYLPRPGVHQQARDDLAPLILSREMVDANPPPRIKNPNWRPGKSQT